LKISQVYNQKEQEKIPKDFCAFLIKGGRGKNRAKKLCSLRPYGHFAIIGNKKEGAYGKREGLCQKLKIN
jgi:hypothetical protein